MDHKAVPTDRNAVIGTESRKEVLVQQFAVFGKRVDAETAFQLGQTAVPPQKRQRSFRRHPHNQGVAILRRAGAQRDGTVEGGVTDHPFGHPCGITENDVGAFMQRLAAV